MDNIFDRLVKGIPKPPEKDVKALSEIDRDRQSAARAVSAAGAPVQAAPAEPQRKESLTDVILRWQKTNDPEDTKYILKRMQPTIRSAMTSFAKGMDDDLAVQAAKLTLNSLKTFNPSYNVAPNTYVFHGLKRLNRLGARRNNVMYMSEEASHERRYVADVMNRFEDEHGREPSIGEIADITGYNTKKVTKIMDESSVTSTSSTLSEDDKKSVLGTRDTTDDDYFEYVYASCGPIDQKILEWSGGKHGMKMLSNGEIAKRLHITPAAVSQRRQKLQRLYSEAYSLV